MASRSAAPVVNVLPRSSRINRASRRRDLAVDSDRVEQRPERLVEVDVADHCHPRHQQTGLRFCRTIVPNERLAQRAHRAATGKQQRQPRKAEIFLRIAGYQPGNQRVGESAMRGEPLEVHGDGLQSRDFSYIDNVVSANLLAMDAHPSG